MVSWFYIKKACEPIHVQLNLPDRMVSIINTRPRPERDLKVRARAFDMHSRLLWDNSARTSVAANAYQEAFAVPEPGGVTPIYFVKLELHDGRGRLLSDNFYWFRAEGTQELKALQWLPPVRLRTTCRVESHGAEQIARVKLTNPNGQIAFLVQLALTQGRGGAEILPVLWDDNYFSLLPGEAREISARFATQDAGRAKATLEVGGWNVESDFDCATLAMSAKEVRAGEPFSVTASIANTFLDGSRVCLRVDGQPTAFRWAWARGGQAQELPFRLVMDRAGKHTVVVGDQKLELKVQP